MIFLVVFVPSVVLTAVIGLFLALTWRSADRDVRGLYWGAALAVICSGGGCPISTAPWRCGTLADDRVDWSGHRGGLAHHSFRRRRHRPALSGGARGGAPVASSGRLCRTVASVWCRSGVWQYWRATVREAEVRINGLPAALDGLRIANLADVHIGRFSSVEDLADAIEVINGRHVELLAITGDLIDDLTQLEPALDALERSAARSIVAVLGNHDKMANEKAVVDAYRRRALDCLLVNSSTVIALATPISESLAQTIR